MYPEAWDVIEVLGNKLRYATSDYDMIPGLVTQLVDEGMWQSFVTPRGEVCEYSSFEEFVATPPLAGLGSSVESLKRACTDDKTALDALDRAVKRPVGANQYTNKPVNNVNGRERPQGNSESQALRRLRKDRPDLHAEVLAGKLSAHAAMVDAGFRPKTVSICVTDAASAARTILRNSTQEFRNQLIEALTEEDQ